MAGGSLMDDVLSQAKKAVAEHGTITKAAKALGIPRTTLMGRIEKAGRIESNGETAKPHEHIKLQDTIRDLRTYIKQLERANITTEEVRREILGLSDLAPRPPEWCLKIKRESGGGEGVPQILISDVHFGEVVRPDQVNNCNEYNIDVARQRLARLTERVVYLAKYLNPPKKPFPGIVAGFAGDMISGDIHDELKETNEIPLMPALLELFDLLVAMLNCWADEFGRVFVPWVIGNHARNTQRIRYKDSVYSNFDWLLGSLLERHFRGDKRFQFMVPNSLDAYYSVYGIRYRMTHGHTLGTFGGDGLIGFLGPVLRGDFKVRRQASSQGEPYDILAMGHFHEYCPLQDRGVLVNGSVIGYGEFAQGRRFAVDPPKQAFWFTHPEHGVIVSKPILLSETPTGAGEAAPWVSWLKGETNG